MENKKYLKNSFNYNPPINFLTQFKIKKLKIVKTFKLVKTIFIFKTFEHLKPLIKQNIYEQVYYIN